MSPRISVVVPLYNKGNYVVRAIQSILSQGDAVLEVLVVDDGSTDSGPTDVESLNEPKVRLIRKKNGGVSSARNMGIREARGEYITFLDADDIYLEGFIAEILQLMKHFPSALIYATSYYKEWPDGSRQAYPLPRTFDSIRTQLVGDPFTAWSRGSFIHIGSLCVPRNIFFRENIFFPVGENVGEDQDVIFRLMETGDVAFSPKPLMSYSQQVANSLYNSPPDYLMPCYSRLGARARTGGYPLPLKAGAYRTVSAAYLNTARILIQKGRHPEAAKFIFQFQAMFHFTYWFRTLTLLFLPTRLVQLTWLKRI
jgi:glycosyltransferase involved in cell wall biosynthesis